MGSSKMSRKLVKILGGHSNTLCCFMLHATKTNTSSDWMGQLGSRTDLTCLTIIVVYFSIYLSMVTLWKYVSLVVGGLDSGLSGLGFRSGLIIVLCS